MDEEDHAFFDDDFDHTGKSAPLKSSGTAQTNGKSKPSLFQIHCDLHGSSNRLTTTEKEQQQKQHKSYSTDDSSDDSKSSDDDDLFTPKSSEKSSMKPYDKEDYERDISKRSNSPFVLSSSDSEDDDDDTLTDVSPRSSPEASPNMKRSFRYSFSEEDDENGQRRRRRAKKEFPVMSSDEDEPQESVKHITKLNVTFKRDNEEKQQQQRSDKVTRGNTRKAKLQQNRKRHKGQGGVLEIDHIEGSLSRYFEKDHNKASANRPKSAQHHRSNPSRPLHMVDNNNHTTEASDGYKTIDFEDQDNGADSDKSTVDLNHLLEIILDLEEKGVNVKEKYKEQSSRRQASRQQQQRKNMSFSNNQAREIERENNRLFKEITKRSSSTRSSRPGSSNSVRSRQSVRSNASSRTSTSTMSSGRRSRTQQATTTKPYHSAVNRINLQRQIERENMQILKRLQDAKPTASLQRTNQLREYTRQTKYMASTPSPTSAGRHRRRYAELSRDPDVIQQALDIGERRFRQIRPAWQDVW